MFSLNIPIISIILTGATIIPIVFLLTLYRSRISCIIKHAKICRASSPDSLPSVSVIVYSHNDSDNLAHILTDILNQSYPSPFEVIVLNDGSSEATKDIVTELSQTHKNLYITYTPEEARYLSRKKLSLTIGIKAAKHDYVVITNSSCRIKSKEWLASIAQHFAKGKEIVIGYASYPVSADKKLGARSRAFNTVIDATKYLSSAIKNKPYRGIDANIAYSRDLFFKNKGFSRSLNLHHGDDDIFISEIATSNNTAVELSPESYIECIYRREPKVVYREQKSIRNFNSKHIKHTADTFFGLCSAMIWIWLTLSIAAIITSLPNLVITSTIFVLSLILWIPLIIAWKKTAATLHSRKAMLTIPFFLLYRPFHNALHNIRSRKSDKYNYTWQKI
ncbi:MAG: glycosyltransferase [Muribaculaceae bacterium]|nr:glycosyltransferase [Muribaculaceae bacterium]